MKEITKEELPKSISKLAGGKFHYPIGCYIIVLGNGDILKLSLDQNFEIQSTTSVTYNNKNLDYVNGFARVLLSDGKYGYVEEETKTLMPYSFDIAFDFNELGFAIVGEKRIGFINKKDLYNNDALMIFKEKLIYEKIENFEKIKDINIAKVVTRGQYDGKHISFIDENGEKIEFIKILDYNGNNMTDSKTDFLDLNDTSDFNWNDKGIIYNVPIGEIIFAEGYYTTANDFVYHCHINNEIPDINSLTMRVNSSKTKKMLYK